jgi:hypothetical protein
MGNIINEASEVYAAYSLYTVSVASPVSVTLASQTTAWKPSQWNGLSSDIAQLATIKTNISDGTNYYFFDAVLHADHTTTVKATEHPVQTGANIADHAYMMPSRLILSIAMSDAMQSLNPANWSKIPTKSVSAYRTLVNLQQSRVPLTILTRLNSYDNMIIEQINAPDDYKTIYGLKCTITLRQIMTGTVATTTTGTSSATQVTGSTNTGSVATSTADDNSSLLSKIETAVTGTS